MLKKHLSQTGEKRFGGVSQALQGNGAAAGQLKKAHPGLGTVIAAEQYPGGILLGNGPGVDDNIWLFGPGRTVVDALGEKALAGAVFADEGHRVLHFRQRFALRHHPPDDGGGAEDVFPLVMGKKFPGAVHFLAAGVIRL